MNIGRQTKGTRAYMSTTITMNWLQIRNESGS